VSDNKLKPIDDDDEIAKIAPFFKDDYDLFLFYLSWLKNGLNATVAYKELHPEVKEHSASVLGSRLLAKVDKNLLMQANGLDHQKYYNQLKDGMDATKWNDFTGEREPDHKTRQPYHDKLGKLLDIEKEKPSDVVIPIINIQINENGVVEKGGEK
jgi:hypothetical protein